MSASVPVLLITGPVGVGKTSTADAASWLLSQQGTLHACVDLPQISKAFPEREDDRWNERLGHRNLACMWQNFKAAGADRLILTRVLESRSLLRRIERAVPGAQVVVVRLRAPLDVVEARIRAREQTEPDWFLAAARFLVPAMDAQQVEDYVIDNSASSVHETAREVLSAVGWLPV
jgi:adenylylsulfate kinase